MFCEIIFFVNTTLVNIGTSVRLDIQLVIIEHAFALKNIGLLWSMYFAVNFCFRMRVESIIITLCIFGKLMINTGVITKFSHRKSLQTIINLRLLSWITCILIKWWYVNRLPWLIYLRIIIRRVGKRISTVHMMIIWGMVSIRMRLSLINRRV